MTKHVRSSEVFTSDKPVSLRDIGFYGEVSGISSPRLGKAIAPANASKFLLSLHVSTDLLGGSVYNRKYKEEKILVDTYAELEDGCLIVYQFSSGLPWLAGFLGFTRRNQEGRFVTSGHPTECYELSSGIRHPRSSNAPFIRIIGRYVGEPRRFPEVG